MAVRNDIETLRKEYREAKLDAVALARYIADLVLNGGTVTEDLLKKYREARSAEESAWDAFIMD